MKLNETIKKVLSEETLKDSLIDLIKTDGIERALKTVGGIKRLAKILEIDFEDIDTRITENEKLYCSATKKSIRDDDELIMNTETQRFIKVSEFCYKN